MHNAIKIWTKKILNETSLDQKDLEIIDCEDCGFIHLNPIPSGEQLEEFYKNKYHGNVKQFNYSGVTDEHMERYKRSALSNSVFKEKLDFVEKNMQSKIKRMLDFGCGNSGLSYLFMKNAWEAFALEPSINASNFIKRYGVEVVGDFSEYAEKYRAKPFSFINFSFVLEHVPDPRSVLRTSYELLDPGGIVCVEVPNDFSLGQLMYNTVTNSEYPWVFYPDHINYFSFASLRKLLEVTGFRIVYQHASFPLEFLLMSGVDYYNEPEEQKKVGGIVSKFENSFYNTGNEAKLSELYQALAALGYGRKIYMYAIKELDI